MSNGPSSPDVVSATFPVEHSTRVSSEAGSRSSIPRSASYTHLPEHGKAKATHEMYSISRSLSENVLSISQGNISRKSATKFGLGGTVKSRKSFRHLGSRKHRSRESDPQLAMSKLTLGEDNPSVVLPYEPETPKDEVVLDKARKTLSVTGSISNFARKSWIANSRSPSPSPGKRKSRKEIHTTPEATCDSSLPKFTQSSSVPVTETKNEKLDGTLNGRASRSPQRRNSDLSRKPKRPLSSILSKAPAFDAPLVPPIPKSFSVDKLPSFKSSTLSNIPPVPKSRSSERLQSMGVESPQKKDELWSTFRALDGEYQK